MNELPDGTYSIFVIDAEEVSDEGVRLELTVTAGEHKGEVIAIRASHLRGDPIMLMGLPGTLTVVDGTPRIDIEE